MVSNNQTTVKSVEEKAEQKNAHVIAKINEDWYKTSEVTITDTANTKSKKILKSFELLKRELTGLSHDHKVVIHYHDHNEKYTFERRQSFTVEVRHKNEKLKERIKSLSIGQHYIRDILKVLPKGFEIDGVQAYNFYHDGKDNFVDKSETESLELRIGFEKVTKKEFDKGVFK